MTQGLLRRPLFTCTFVAAFAATSACAYRASAAPATAATGSACPDARTLTRSLSEPLATVRFLADDALEGRLAGSAGERCAGDYIAARFAQLGLQPAGTGGTYFQDVPLASVLNPHAQGGSGRNVVALLEGSDARVRDEYIVIGAHYDHLGHGTQSSLEPGANAIHNGADDNASGVAALLRAAALLTEGQRPARSILFIAFTGEESGLLGSAFFTRQPTLPLSRARAMLNLDMVGRLEGGTLIVYGVETAAEWRALLERAAERHGVKLAMRGDGYGPSDHTSFYSNDVPVLHFFTNTHADYHRPSDDWQKIDAAGLEQISRLLSDVARSLTGPSSTVTLRRGAGEPPRTGGGGGYGAYLGTVPDFTPVERGVLLGGVTAGSPGDAAGLRKGDIVIRLGTHDVRDLQGMTDALRAYRPGESVDVVVLRDGRELTLRAVLGRRG